MSVLGSVRRWHPILVAAAIVTGAILWMRHSTVTKEGIAVATGIVAGLVTVSASVVAALKSVSTDKKADTITLLVDGRYGDVLKELAEVRGLLADQSGSAVDLERAVEAQAKSDAQSGRVDVAAVAQTKESKP